MHLSSVEGMLQAQVLKYILRLWHKDNTVEDAKKANWYLERLISKLIKRPIGRLAPAEKRILL